jgi:hypothetical protein
VYECVNCRRVARNVGSQFVNVTSKSSIPSEPSANEPYDLAGKLHAIFPELMFLDITEPKCMHFFLFAVYLSS